MLYSHSRLETFVNCPLRFRYQYIDKVAAPLEKGIEAFLGTVVHDALEKLYTDIKFQKNVSLEGLLEYFREQWKRNWNDEIVIVRKGYGQREFRKMGEKFLTDYFRRYRPFNQGRTIALEKRVMIRLDPEGRYRLQGYIDRLTDAGNGVYEIHDYKTNSNLPVREYIKNDRQLALYALAVRNDYPDVRKIRLVWHFLAFDKEWVLEKTDREFEELRKETIELIKRIEKEEKFSPKVSKLCDWCQFRPVCPKWKHIYRTEQLEPNRFLKEPGVKLVNRYAELLTKKRKQNEEIDRELEMVKDAMVKLCKKEGIAVLAGSDHDANVWIRDVLRFPNKDEEGREELEEIIRKSGKWDELSNLDTFALSRKIGTGELPPELEKKLRKFGKKEEISRIYLKKAPERGGLVFGEKGNG